MVGALKVLPAVPSIATSKRNPLMIMTIVALLATSIAPPPKAGPERCRRFLTGNWAGKGTVKDFGPPIEVDNAAAYRSDGTFKTRNRYLGDDKKWAEQIIAGRWSATNGAKLRSCKLVMNTEGSGFKAGSTSDIRVIDPNTYRSLGFNMKRVRAGQKIGR
jgi:hypothetical protein